MWKCPQCETLNKEAKCIVCGEPNPYYPKVTLEHKDGNSKLRSTMRNKNIGNVSQSNFQNDVLNGINNYQQHTAPTFDVMSRQQTANASKQTPEEIVSEKVLQNYPTPESAHYPEANPDMGVVANEQINTATTETEAVTYVPVAEPETTRYAETEYIDDAYEMPRDKKNKSKMRTSTKWIIGIAASLVVLVGGTFGFLEIQRARAESAYNNSNFAEAKEIYSTVAFYRDSRDKMKKCDYEEAEKLLEKGKYAEARAIYDKLDGYSNSDYRIVECDYSLAMEDIEDDRLVEAYEKLVVLDKENYEDSSYQLQTVISKLFEKGKREYENQNYGEAKKCFETYSDGSKTMGLSVDYDYQSYLTLIEARQTKIPDVTVLYDLIDFADTKDVLLSNKYIVSFLMGEWKNSNNDKLEFYEEGNGVKYRSTLPVEVSGSYKLSDGVQYHGSDDTEWIKVFEYKIIRKDRIEVYCCKDGKTYTMNRQRPKETQE